MFFFIILCSCTTLFVIKEAYSMVGIDLLLFLLIYGGICAVLLFIIYKNIPVY